MDMMPSKVRWGKLIAGVVVTAIVATMLFASFFPWLAALTGLMLLIGGIAYAAWPPVSERIAAIRARVCPPLQRRIYLGLPVARLSSMLLWRRSSIIAYSRYARFCKCRA